MNELSTFHTSLKTEGGMKEGFKNAVVAMNQRKNWLRLSTSMPQY